MILYPQIVARCFVNLPYYWLKKGYLQVFLDRRLQPEIGLDGDVLDTVSLREFEEVARLLAAEDLACTLHAPFLGLEPGAADPDRRQRTREKLGKAFALIPVFRPRSIVCHLGHGGEEDAVRAGEWCRHSLETWHGLLSAAERYRTPIMLENTYEASPRWHRLILEALATEQARFCLDVGHVQAFARSHWHRWLPELEPWLGQLHLHDNSGETDQHLAIGKGTVDFAGLFSYLAGRGLAPIMTLEPHSEEGLWESLASLAEMEEFREMLAC